jgi:hypothetical protein
MTEITGINTGTDYHYILTLQWMPTPSQVGTSTRAGLTQVGSGETRDQVFVRLLAWARQEMGVPAHCAPVTLFFALEPAVLPIGGAR